MAAIILKRKGRSSVSKALLMSTNTMAPVESWVIMTAGRREVKVMLSWMRREGR
jgi:hypothetical protein